MFTLYSISMNQGCAYGLIQ